MKDALDLLGELREPLGRLGLSLEDGGRDCRLEILAGDGSDRQFFRIRQRDLRWVLLHSPPERDSAGGEDLSYLLIGTHLLSRGVPVPQILWSDLSRGLFVLEDLGDCHVQKLALRPMCRPDPLYAGMLKLLVHLHQRSRAGFRESFCFDTPVYDAAFIYARELEYFRKAFLVGCLNEEIDESDLRADFENLAESAGKFPPSLVFHRDFQSRNVMMIRGTLKIIDFQGMRFGPPTYDLASMLLDPYVSLDERLQRRLVRAYWKMTQNLWEGRFGDFKASYEAVRLCRNLQVLGAYGFLGLQKGKTQFLKYIPCAWDRLLSWLGGPVKGRYPLLERTVRRAEHHKAHWIRRPWLLAGPAGSP